MINLPYISAFLTKVEGPCQTRGYVPCFKKSGGTANYRGDGEPGGFTAMGASGVTIATGCDLGQTDAQTQKRFGLAGEIIAYYEPYYGLKRDAALAKLHRQPLTITPEQARATDAAVHKGYLETWVRPFYDRQAAANFAGLPEQAQAVIMSLCFQKGCAGVAKDWPKVWSYLLAGDWARASQELLTGFRQYANRRKIEGRLLMELCQ